jgi:hypothetical protein
VRGSYQGGIDGGQSEDLFDQSDVAAMQDAQTNRSLT